MHALGCAASRTNGAARSHASFCESVNVTTLREAALASGYISGKDFDRIVKPSAMVGE